MTSRTLATTTALICCMALGGHAMAADAGAPSPRNWGGFWLGFGVGYASSTYEGQNASETCLTEQSSAAAGATETSCEFSSQGLEVSTIAFAPGRFGTAFATNEGTASLTPDPTDISSNNTSFSDLRDRFGGTGRAIGVAVANAEPPGDVFASTSATAVGGSKPIADAEADASSGTSTFTDEAAGVAVTVSTPVSGEAFASGVTLANSRNGITAGASYASAIEGVNSASALAIGFSGMPGDTGSDGGLTPNINFHLDHQTVSNWIIGAELDVSMPAGDDNKFSAVTELAPQFNVEQGFEIDTGLLASARLRLGYAMGDFMFYGTGGVAYTNFDATFTSKGTYQGMTLADEPSSESGDAFGGVIGGGISAFVSDNAAISFEGLYYRFNEEVDFGNDASVTLDDAFSVMTKFTIRTN